MSEFGRPETFADRHLADFPASLGDRRRARFLRRQPPAGGASALSRMPATSQRLTVGGTDAPVASRAGPAQLYTSGWGSILGAAARPGCHGYLESRWFHIPGCQGAIVAVFDPGGTCRGSLWPADVFFDPALWRAVARNIRMQGTASAHRSGLRSARKFGPGEHLSEIMFARHGSACSP